MKRIITAAASAFVLIVFAAYATVTPKSNPGDINNVADTAPSKTYYLDINTGDTIDMFYNEREGKAYNLKDKSPVQFYINSRTSDTVYGRGRVIVNGFVKRWDDGVWNWDTTKVKIDAGGEIKFKDGKKKVKIDDSELKVKQGDIKWKTNKGKTKLKTPEGKVKEGENKPEKVKSKVED